MMEKISVQSVYLFLSSSIRSKKWETEYIKIKGGELKATSSTSKYFVKCVINKLAIMLLSMIGLFILFYFSV